MTPLIRLTPVGATIVVKQLSSSLRTLDLANVVRVEERSKADKKEKSRSTMRANAVELPAEQLESLWLAVSTLGYLDKLSIDRPLSMAPSNDPPSSLMTSLIRYLDKLSIDRDHLRDLPNLGKLLSLKHLSAANNKLTAIPDDIAYVRGLKQLTLVGNSLRELNSAIGDLELLEKLEVR